MTRLSAEQLGIKQWEYDALIEARERLADGRIGPEEFDMCGSVCCIGGHMAKLENKGPKAFYALDERSNALAGLFFPNEIGPWQKIAPRQAVQAIDNFLASGDPKWPEVCPHLVEGEE